MKQIWYMGDDSHQTSWICFLMFLNDVTFGMRLHHKHVTYYKCWQQMECRIDCSSEWTECLVHTFGNVFIDNGFVYTTLQLLKTSSRLIWNEKKRWVCLITYLVNDTNAIEKNCTPFSFVNKENMYAFLYPQIAKKFIYEHAIVMQSFFRQNWLVIIFMMLVKQLLSNQSTRIKQNSAMSRQIKFYSIRNEPIETFLSCRPPFYGGWCISLSWTYNTTWNTNFAKSC